MVKEFFYDNFRRPSEAVEAAPNAKPRIKYIDLAKGIAIILVVLYHNNLLTDVPGLTAARMPLYFVLSGLFFKTYSGFFDFLFKKTNNILIPFIFFAFIGFLIAVYLKNLKPVYVLTLIWHRPYLHNTAVWFLICLFWVNILFFIINSCSRGNRWVQLGAVAACGVTGFLLHQRDHYIPFFISTSLSAMPFFYFGMIIRKYLLNMSVSLRTTLLIAASLLIAGVLFSWLRGTPSIEFRLNRYIGHPAEIFFNSLVMVSGLLMLCKAIVWLPVISYFGRYSIIVLGFHTPFMSLLNYLARQGMFHKLGNIEMAAAVLLLCWLIIPLSRRFIPVLTAQSPLLLLPQKGAFSTMLKTLLKTFKTYLMKIKNSICIFKSNFHIICRRPESK